VNISDILSLAKQYGWTAVAIALLIVVVIFLYRQQNTAQNKAIGDCQEQLRVAAVRADRLEAEVKSLNVTLQQYLAMGFAIKQTMQAAATEINK
jgi:hypothetical protein